MNAKEFEVAFYEAMAKWVAGGKISPDPRGEIEILYADQQGIAWTHINTCHPEFLDTWVYRWKPAKKRTVTIDGVELVAPEVDAPTYGDTYFCENWHGDFEEETWRDTSSDESALVNSKVFLTREDCQAMSDAQRKQRIVGVA